MMQRIAEHWWVPVVRGGVAVLFGLAAFKLPGPALGALVLAFGTYALADGLAAILGVLEGPRHGATWLAAVAGGLVSILAGALAFTLPGPSALALVLLVAARALLTGMAELAVAHRLRGVAGAGQLGVGGVVSMLAGLALLANPAAGAMALAWLIGTYALAYGAIAIALGLTLRHPRTPRLRHTMAPLLSERELQGSLGRRRNH